MGKGPLTSMRRSGPVVKSHYGASIDAEPGVGADCLAASLRAAFLPSRSTLRLAVIKCRSVTTADESLYKPESEGNTPSERYLTHLGRRSFLSLWSYSNLFTDEGRHHGKGDGKELADLLVVFDTHVLIFSDKHCEFPTHPDLKISWARWYKRAIEKSARQAVGARSWLLRFPNRIYLDKSCQKPFP